MGRREYRRLAELRWRLEGQREVGANRAVGERDGAAVEALETILRRGWNGGHGGLHRRDGEQRARRGQGLRRLEVGGVRGPEEGGWVGRAVGIWIRVRGG